MTTLTLNYLTKGYSFTLKPVFKFAKSIFISFGSALIMSRQCSANEKIVPYLIKEYPGHTYDSMLAQLDDQAVARFQKELEEDK